MMVNIPRSFCAGALTVLAACAQIADPNVSQPDPSTARPTLRPTTQIDAPPASATTVEEFDTTTQADREVAVATPAAAGERQIGTTIASLGNPADPGFWLETPLVTERQMGRIVYKVTGKSVAVELIPIAGPKTAASRISLPAIRLLGAPLTGLPELTVFAG